jgi:hypothetical protein
MLNACLRRAAPWARAIFISLTLPDMAVHAAEPIPEPATPVPFKHYQAWQDAPLKDWRQANDRVGEIGGWRTYLRESQQDGEGMDSDGHDHHGHHGH